MLVDLMLRSKALRSPAHRAALARDYAAAYRRHFARRIRWSGFVGRLTMNVRAAGAAAALMAHVPGVLRLGAEWSGKRRKLAA